MNSTSMMNSILYIRYSCSRTCSKYRHIHIMHACVHLNMIFSHDLCVITK